MLRLQLVWSINVCRYIAILYVNVLMINGFSLLILKQYMLRICLATGSPSGTPKTGWSRARSLAARTYSQVQSCTTWQSVIFSKIQEWKNDVDVGLYIIIVTQSSYSGALNQKMKIKIGIYSFLGRILIRIRIAVFTTTTTPTSLLSLLILSTRYCSLLRSCHHG